MLISDRKQGSRADPMKTVVKKIPPAAARAAYLSGLLLSGILFSCSPFSGDDDDRKEDSQGAALHDGSEVLVRDEDGIIRMARIESYGSDGRPERVFSYWRELGAIPDSGVFSIDTLAYTADGKLLSSKTRSWRAGLPESPTLFERTYSTELGEAILATEKTSLPYLSSAASSSSASFTFSMSVDGTKDTLRARLKCGSVDTTFFRRLRVRYEDGSEDGTELELYPIGRKGADKTFLASWNTSRSNLYMNGKLIRSASAIQFGATVYQNTIRTLYSGEHMDSVIVVYPFGKPSKGKCEYRQLAFAEEIRKVFPGTPVE
jgi:hypothetical protein